METHTHVVYRIYVCEFLVFYGIVQGTRRIVKVYREYIFQVALDRWLVALLGWLAGLLVDCLWQVVSLNVDTSLLSTAAVVLASSSASFTSWNRKKT